MRQNVLAHIPPSCQEFREIISKSIACFKYGETLDRTFLNITAVGRDVEQNHTCICNDNNWSEYTVCLKDSSRCVLTTDVSCLRDKDAEAVLKLPAS